MKNGSISTGTMIRLLIKHAKDIDSWTASAPDSSGWGQMRGEARNGGIYIYARETLLSIIPDRDDWTIYKNGIRVSQLTFIGTFVKAPGVFMGLDDIKNSFENLPAGTHDVYVKSR